MLTTADITKLKKVFVTKTELKNALEPYATRSEMYAMGEDIKSELKNEFITRFDAVMGELKAIREELTLGNYRRSENSDLLENHENRITCIETQLAGAP